MTTAPNADIGQTILSQTFWSAIAFTQAATFKVAMMIEESLPQGEPLDIPFLFVKQEHHLDSIKERFLQGEPLEAILTELVHSAGEAPEGKLLSAVRHLYLRRYDEAFRAFEESYRELWPILSDAVKAAPDLSQRMEQWRQDFYKRWALPGILHGLEGFLTYNLDDMTGGGKKVIEVLRRAKEDGQEDAIWSFVSLLANSLPPEAQHQVQEFGRFVWLIAIEDPFEGLRALAKSISAVWPKGVDCVQAVREERH